MKRIIIILALLSAPAYGQWTIGQWTSATGGSGGSGGLTPAATPTFSPVAGAVSNPTLVTSSSTTTGTGCTMYLDTSSTPITAQTTYSVTTEVTLYAQVRGCSGYSDSSVGSSTYTISEGGGAIAYTGNSAYLSEGENTPSPMVLTITGVVAGDTLVSFASTSSAAISSVVDSTGDLVTLVTSVNWNEGGATNYAYVVKNATSGTHTFTVTYSTSYVNWPYLQILEFSGANLSSPIDSFSENSGLSGTSLSAGSITTSNASEMIVASFNVAGSATLTAGSPFTTTTTTDINAIGAYYLEPTAGMYTPTATSTSSLNWNGISIALKP